MVSCLEIAIPGGVVEGIITFLAMQVGKSGCGSANALQCILTRKDKKVKKGAAVRRATKEVFYRFGLGRPLRDTRLRSTSLVPSNPDHFSQN